jgi:hypothetical protein
MRGQEPGEALGEENLAIPSRGGVGFGWRHVMPLTVTKLSPILGVAAEEIDLRLGVDAHTAVRLSIAEIVAVLARDDSDLRYLAVARGDSSLRLGVPKARLVVGAYWHSDDSYKRVPCPLTMLYGVEVPSTGGDTQFINMYAACEDLSPATKERIAQALNVLCASTTSSPRQAQVECHW